MFQHGSPHPGNKRGSMQTRLKSLRTGTMMTTVFARKNSWERAILDEIEFEYLYSGRRQLPFHDTKTYEQMECPAKKLGETIYYLVPNTIVKVGISRRKKPSESIFRTPWICA